MSVKYLIFKIAGVLTDADSVTLADITDAYGIKKTSDDSIIVDSGTAVTKVSTGRYEYDISEICEEEIEYEIFWKVVYAGNTQYVTDVFTLSATSPELTSSNCYTTLALANTYFSERYGGSGWSNLSDAQKSQALITATRKIDRLPLRGRKYLDSEFQPLAFPRDFDDGVIHERVKQACCEEAFALTKTELQKRKELQQSGVKSFSLSKLSESYQGNSFSSSTLFSSEAIDLLNPWLMGAVKII